MSQHQITVHSSWQLMTSLTSRRRERGDRVNCRRRCSPTRLIFFLFLSWRPCRYFLLCVNYFFYGETVTDYFFTLVQREEPLRILSKYHRFISFALYLTGTPTAGSTPANSSPFVMSQMESVTIAAVMFRLHPQWPPGVCSIWWKFHN